MPTNTHPVYVKHDRSRSAWTIWTRSTEPTEFTNQLRAAHYLGQLAGMGTLPAGRALDTATVVQLVVIGAR